MSLLVNSHRAVHRCHNLGLTASSEHSTVPHIYAKRTLVNAIAEFSLMIQSIGLITTRIVLSHDSDSNAGPRHGLESSTSTPTPRV